MTDPRFESLHLAEMPRRSEFRAARDRLRATCGEGTLAGDLGWLDAADAADAGGTSTLAAAPDAKLTFWVQDGGTRHPLAVGVNSIGRLPDNTVVLKDDHVSRRHCAIVIHRDGHCEVHDIASKNGTLLNGEKIAGPTTIRPGDSLTLCNHRVTFIAIIAETADRGELRTV